MSDGGNGLFATQKIEAGDLIARISDPFLAVLDSPFVNEACFNCFVRIGEDGSNSGWGDPNFKLSKCTGCKVASFCGKVGFVRACARYDNVLAFGGRHGELLELIIYMLPVL